MAGRTMLAATIVAASVPSTVMAAAPDPAVMDQEIGRVAGDAVVAGLFQSGRCCVVESHISAGDPAWVRIAGGLRHTPLGCASCAENLPISLAFAPKRDPAAVLTVLGTGRDIERVCGMPFIEPPAGFKKTYLTKAMESLRTVSDPALASRREERVQHLQHEFASYAFHQRMTP
jgi:hypothetical protein